MCEMPKVEGVHPGLMIMTALGVARALNEFEGLYMCGVHTHAGTVPTFPEEMEAFVEKWHMRLLVILYMSSYVLGGEGPSALAALNNTTAFTISPEFRDPRIGPGNPTQIATYGHNTYVRDGLSLMGARELGTYVARELLLATIGVLLQLPQSMDFCLDRRTFIEAFRSTDEDGNPIVIEDYLSDPRTWAQDLG
ncbi:hypothetical protein C8R44DRAFT_333764 [Mycena epipterygia]|nr:hypothetical protein C8R44DRAFT_333764 [Mycena epipterygia]